MLTLISPPAALAVSLAELRAHLRLEGIDEGGETDALLMGYARTAQDRLDGPDGILGRCLIRQTWRLALDCFPAVIELPLPPLAEVLSVTYLDPAGDPQTLDPADYIVAGVGSDGSIRPAVGKSWPTTRALPEAVTVDFAAGADDWNGVPQPLRDAIAEMVRAAFDGCDPGQAVRELIRPYRAHWTV
jgi:uncharacterized phiE125 gp8 family phage protein